MAHSHGRLVGTGFRLGTQPKLWGWGAWFLSTGSGFLTAWQPCPKLNVLREQGRSTQHFCELARDVVQHRFHDTLLLKAVANVLPGSRGEVTQTLAVEWEGSKKACGVGNTAVAIVGKCNLPYLTTSSPLSLYPPRKAFNLNALSSRTDFIMSELKKVKLGA